jgi:hypothetical protein
MPNILYICDNTECAKEFLIRSSLRNGKKHYCSRVCAHLGRIKDLYNNKKYAKKTT